MNRQEWARRVMGTLGVWAVVLSVSAPAYGDASPTGRTPKVYWSSQKQALWNRMRAESHPWWQEVKRSADLSGTASARYADLGQWATLAFQVTGDPVYAAKAWTEAKGKLKGTTVPDSSRNFTRERFIEYAWMYDWLHPALTAAQRQQWIDSLNYWADLCLGNTSVSWGTRTGDSDETVGHYFGILLWALVSQGENPRAAEFLADSQVGGLEVTGNNRNTQRNAIADYVRRSEGGQWIESTKYNMGTLQLLLMGAEGVRSVVGQDKFPEVTAALKDFALGQMHEVASDLRQGFQWGDNEEPRGLNRDRRMALAVMLAGLLEGDASIGPVMAGFRNAIQGSEAPWFRWMLFGNPYAPTADFRSGLALSHYAPGMGLLFARDRWSSGGSLFASHMAARSTVDHEVQYASHVELYRKGEHALTHVIGYGASNGEHHNSMLLAGLSAMKEAKGSFAADVGANGAYAYHVGGTGGNRYTNGYYNPPPRFLHEWVRSVLYLPSADGTHDTVVMFDRVNAEDPETLVKLDRYSSSDRSRITGAPALKQWVIHAPVSPALSPAALSWSTSGGQQVRVSTLLPADQTRQVYDESTMSLSGTIRDSERKFQVRIRPGATRRWDAFLNVVQAADSLGGLTNRLVQSANGEAAGALVARPGHADTLALFNATQGPDLPPSNTSSSRLVVDKTLLDRLDANRLRTGGYTVSWNAGTATDVFLADLSPSKEWLVSVDGRAEQPLNVSQAGLGQLAVPGSGAHTLQLRAAGDVVDTTPPSISGVQAASLTSDGAVISWTTDEPATQQVEYGLSSAFGSWTPLDGSLSTSHAVALAGLAADTTYVFRVHSADAAGNAAVSSSGTFRTLAPAEPPPPPASEPAPNQAPVMGALDAQVVDEGQLLTVGLSASDPENDALTFTAIGLPAGATLSGATVSWTPDFTQAGHYEAAVQVSDGELTDTEPLVIDVRNVNQPPSLTLPLVQEVAEGQMLTLLLTASDPDGDALTFSAQDLPAGAVLTGNTLTWTPGFDQAGSYTIAVSVSDGSLSALASATIVVDNTNRAPLAGATGPSPVVSGTEVSLDGRASLDPDGDAITYQWLQLAGPSVVIYNPPPEQPHFTAPMVTQPTELTFGLTVSDGTLTGQTSVTLTVEPAPSPGPEPVISDAQVASGRRIETARLAVGQKVYTDRTYTVASFPAALAGQEFLRLPNEDKYRKDSAYLTFTLTQLATVYVAFDPRADTLPSWLKNAAWAPTGETLSVAGDGSRVLYRRSYPAGTVKLGGNGALWKQDAYSQYTVIVVPAQ